MGYIVGALLLFYYLQRRTSGKPIISPIAYSKEQKLERIKNTLRYADIIGNYAMANQIDPACIAAIIAIESEGIPCKIARGANDEYIGLMALGYKTAQWQGYSGLKYSNPVCPPLTGLFDPATNVFYGVKYFAYQYKRYNLVTSAISAYQLGSAKINSDGTIANLGYVKSVSDFIPDFRSYFATRITAYEGLFPAGIWNPQTILA